MSAPACVLASREILGVRVDATDYLRATDQVLEWARAGESRYVCLSTVSQIMEAHDAPDFRAVLREADLATSDGMPLVWLLRWLGIPHATRVYGPDLMPLVLVAAARAGIAVGFYGGEPDVLKRLVRKAARELPALRVTFAEAPPFRPLTEEEDRRVVESILDSGARILFVGTGSPKQDRWMHAHKGRVHAVMLGVGAAFDFLTGSKPQAPMWMQRHGLEWLFRFMTEPRRLWRRALWQNPRFIALVASQLFRARSS